MNRFFTFFAISIFSLAVSAQTITTLDWEEMHIDSVLPEYHEMVPLAEDFRNYDYTVTCEYAGWGQLTSKESKWVKAFEDVIGSDIYIKSNVTAIRGKGYLEITFVPIIRSGKDTYKKLLQCHLDIKPTAKARTRAQAADFKRYADNSVLATGRWAKISVTQNGIHQITPDLLKKLGFNDPSQIRVFGYGGHLQPEVMNADTHWDDLEEVPTVKSGSNLLFWANGVQRWDNSVTSSTQPHHTVNYFSQKGYYFITEGTPCTIGHEEPGKSLYPQVLQTHKSNVIRDIDQFAWQQSGRTMWEDQDLGDGKDHNFSLSTPGAQNGTSTLRISVASGHKDGSKLTLKFNDTNINSTSVSRRKNSSSEEEVAHVLTQQFTVSNTSSGTSTVTVRGESGHELRLDFIELTYPRSFSMTGAEMPIVLSNAGDIQFTITPLAGQNVALMRIGKRGSPATLIKPKSDNTYVIDNANDAYVAFDCNYNSYPQPEAEGMVKNQNLHAHDPNVDMVIVIPTNGIFDAQAQRLAEAHARLDGQRCRIVRDEHIYNEFGSGTRDVTAIRRYLKMLYDRAQEAGTEPLRNVLMFGPAAFDNRMITKAWEKADINNYLPILESINSVSNTKSYAMDDYCGLLEDGKGTSLTGAKFDIGCGRFHMSTAEDAAIMVDRTIAHLEGLSACNNTAIIAGDDGDNTVHMRSADEVAKVILTNFPEIDTKKVFWDAFKLETTSTGSTYPTLRQHLLKEIGKGASLFLYMGHGSPTQLSHETVFNASILYQMVNQKKGLWFLSACDIAPYDKPIDHFGNALLLNKNGGAVAVITTLRTVSTTGNELLSKAFVAKVFDTDTKKRRLTIGEALAQAKNNISAMENKLQYAVIGDPSLVMGNPQNKIVIDKINGKELATGTPQVQATSTCTIEGHIVDAQGNKLTADGVLHVRFLDNEENITLPNQAGDSQAMTYKEHRKELFEGSNTMRDGNLNFKFVVPAGINYSDLNGRAVFDFVLDKGNQHIFANGYTENYTVGGKSNEFGEFKEGPQITAYLENEKWTDGGITSATPYLYVALKDEIGLNFTAAELGHNLTACIDGRATQTFNMNDSFVFDEGSASSGKAVLSLPLLSQGEHSVEVSAWNVLGNMSTKTLRFYIVKSDLERPVFFTVHSNIGGGVNVTLFNRLSGSGCIANLRLYDLTGKLCYDAERRGVEGGSSVEFPVIMTNGSQQLAPGVYLVCGTITNGNDVYETQTTKIIIK